jgi:virginiamycin A acetyltransferase
MESKGPITIGNDVWIGTQCVILSGSTIGDGAVIAANSVVTADIPPYAIAAGSPARVLRYRFSDAIIERLMKLEWWAWSRVKLEQNRALFEGDLTAGKLDAVEES